MTERKFPPFQYVTVSTKPHPNLELLKDTAEYHKFPCVQVLGMGDKRLQSWGAGFGIKVHYLKEHVTSLVKMGMSDCVVLFTDAYDVLLVQDVTILMERYLAMNSEVVFSAEAACHPDASQAPRYPTHTLTHCRTRYLNSGTFIGTAGSLFKLLQSRQFKTADDDQAYWTEIFLAHHNVVLDASTGRRLIRLDLENQLFQCMARLADILKCMPTNKSVCNSDPRAEFAIRPECVQKPCILHFNGCKMDIGRFYQAWKENRPVPRTWDQAVAQRVRGWIATVI